MLPIIESTHGEFPKIGGGISNGTNTVFTTRWGFAPHTMAKVFKNGLLQSPGAAEDYIVFWAEIGRIDFNTAPNAGDKITIEYWAIGDNS